MKIPIFSLSLVLILSGCATTAKLNLPDNARSADPNDPSRWLGNGNRISFHGELVRGDCDRFKAAVTDNTKTLRVNSVGGDAFEGLCIAREMVRRHFEETQVQGLCVSSCANYLFLGSERRTIANGIVGYHGNITAFTRKNPDTSSLRSQLQAMHVDPKEIDKTIQAFIQHQKVHSTEEQEFLREIGVSQALFDDTQSTDKGAGDGRAYMFLLPTPQTFAKYGVRNVTGTQNFELGRATGMVNLLR